MERSAERRKKVLNGQKKEPHRNPRISMYMQVVPRKCGHVESRRIGDDMILVPIRPRVEEMDSIYTLNDVGGRIWELIDGTKSVTCIGHAIAEEYAVPAGAALRDVVEFLDQLASVSFVTLHTGCNAENDRARH